MARKKKGRGGKRPGAGRPRTIADPVEVKIVFEREALTWVDEEAERKGSSRGALVRRAVDAMRERGE